MHSQYSMTSKLAPGRGGGSYIEISQILRELLQNQGNLAILNEWIRCEINAIDKVREKRISRRSNETGRQYKNAFDKSGKELRKPKAHKLSNEEERILEQIVEEQIASMKRKGWLEAHETREMTEEDHRTIECSRQGGKGTNGNISKRRPKNRSVSPMPDPYEQ